MLTLSQIFLHNWHRFTHHRIPVQDSLYLAGHNGSGKSSILDAIQTVLIAHQSRVRFNSSAQERSQRNLDSYVRGKIGEGRWLRPGNTVAYVVLEFCDRSSEKYVTLGVCIEAGEGKTPERLFFIISDALDIDLFVPDGRPLPRRDLKQALRNRRKARSFDQVSEYQTEMLNSLGGLNERFVDLFLRALTFQPMRNIREFVERWLLEEHPLEVENLQSVVERLEQLRATAEQVEDRLVRLEVIERHRVEVHRLQERHAEYTLLMALLSSEAVRRQVADLDVRLAATQQDLQVCQSDLATTRAALTGAQQALIDVEVQLRQSDVMRRRADLERQIRETTLQADEVRTRWVALVTDLRRELTALQPVLGLDAHVIPLQSAEQHALETLQATVQALSLEQPPGDDLADSIDTAIIALDQAVTRSKETLFGLKAQLSELATRQADLEARLGRLRQGQKPYPNAVERLRDLLTPIMGQRPPLLCDLLEVPDDHWQNAVEAMLGPRRFHIIVPAQIFPAAMRELDRARAAEQLYDVGLIDLERAAQDARRAQPGSLAEQVQPRADLLRAYLNTVLGNIICCGTVDELRRYRRAITADVVLYSEWTVRALRPDSYTPRFIGRRAQQSLIDECRRELEEVAAAIASLQPQQRDMQTLVAVLDRGRVLSNLRQRLDAPLDELALRQQIADWQAEIAALDLSGVQELEHQASRLRQLVQQEQEQERQINQRQGRLENALQTLTDQRQAAERERVERDQFEQTLRQRLADAVLTAEALFAERQSDDLTEAMRNAETTAQRFETRRSNELNNLTEAATAYNISYQFVALPGNPDETRYHDEYERLAATELPRYKEQIADAQREAEEELREHVLHRLRERILIARQELDRINDALGRLQFHNERYRFRTQPADETREYYDLINDVQLLGQAGALFKSEFYTSHKAIFDRFYELLTRVPRSEAEREEQRRLTDYRSYLSYDIDVTHADGTNSRLSRIMGQTSGGETQTPFYVTIAASFAQLYHINERQQRPTIRLVAFDEAFSKMDQDRIGATLELLQSFGLQIVTATPLERCEYLVPRMCTSLVLTAIGDMVLIEPYQNYAARLEAYYDGEQS